MNDFLELSKALEAAQISKDDNQLYYMDFLIGIDTDLNITDPPFENVYLTGLLHYTKGKSADLDLLFRKYAINGIFKNYEDISIKLNYLILLNAMINPWTISDPNELDVVINYMYSVQKISFFGWDLEITHRNFINSIYHVSRVEKTKLESFDTFNGNPLYKDQLLFGEADKKTCDLSMSDDFTDNEIYYAILVLNLTDADQSKDFLLFGALSAAFYKINEQVSYNSKIRTQLITRRLFHSLLTLFMKIMK